MHFKTAKQFENLARTIAACVANPIRLGLSESSDSGPLFSARKGFKSPSKTAPRIKKLTCTSNVSNTPKVAASSYDYFKTKPRGLDLRWFPTFQALRILGHLLASFAGMIQGTKGGARRERREGRERREEIEERERPREDRALVVFVLKATRRDRQGPRNSWL